MTAALDRAVANAMGLKSVHNCEKWVGLTDEEIWSTVSRIGTADSDVNPHTVLNDARAIEAKLKEKNTIPLAADDGDFYGLPRGSVSSSNADGNGVTDGETSPTLLQVTPWEFMARVKGREEIVGEPVFWAQWPSKEKK